MAALTNELIAGLQPTYSEYISKGIELNLSSDIIFPVSKEEYIKNRAYYIKNYSSSINHLLAIGAIK